MSDSDREIIDDFGIIPFSYYQSYEGIFYFYHRENIDEDEEFKFSKSKDRFIQALKTKISWKQSWSKFIEDIYNSALILNRDFLESCKNFISHLQGKGLIPTRFNHYLNFDQYRPDYDHYFSNQSNLTIDDVVCLLIGLEPKFLIEYNICESLQNDEGKYSKELVREGIEFFYESYNLFLRDNDICLSGINKIFRHNRPYIGNLENYIHALYNDGFVFDEYLTNHLDYKGTLPKYDEDSWVYKVFDLYSKAQYWTLDDIVSMISGKNPISQAHLISFLGSTDIQSSIQHKADWLDLSREEILEGKKIYKILLKTGDICRIDLIDQFCQKKGSGYSPKDVIKWLVNDTYTVLPEILIRKLFIDNSEVNRLKQENALNKVTMGKPRKIVVEEIFQILIEDVMEEKFDSNNKPHQRQAATIYKKLSGNKRLALRFEENSKFSPKSIIISLADTKKIWLTSSKLIAYEKAPNTKIKICDAYLRETVINPFIEELSKQN